MADWYGVSTTLPFVHQTLWLEVLSLSHDEVQNKNQPPSNQTEIETVTATKSDILLEEFPDGPYGATTDAPQLGKSSPWTAGQASVSAFRDSNPVSSNRTTVMKEQQPHAKSGTIEAEN